ncbi:hypothetical protein MRB53_022058 [Persea americana]|uniref:Uncharacterized protein n=1 Tax=Persea americana TaxID=3435 RepID=A0ACC2L5W5_PERAE|nr:hypothetical protein MRB53_022058 [Persea americana]
MTNRKPFSDHETNKDLIHQKKNQHSVQIPLSSSGAVKASSDGNRRPSPATVWRRQRSLSSPSRSSSSPLSSSGSAEREQPLLLLPVSDSVVATAAVVNQQSIGSFICKRNCCPSSSSSARANPDPRAP